MISITSTQLWREEPACLQKYVQRVPDGGVIVEIGTADGGTAAIIHETVKKRDIKIYTVDIAPSENAYHNLEHTDVEVVRSKSSEFAQVWKESIKRSIDFLFIDGGHTFESVYTDFYSWVPFLKPEGSILFHDYDPPDRGGIAHLGVQIFVETLLNNDMIVSAAHEYRFLFGQINPQSLNLPISAYFDTFIKHADQVKDMLEVPERMPTTVILDKVKSKSDLTSSQACYFLSKIRSCNEKLIIESSSSKAEVRRWLEMLDMIEHAYGPFLYPFGVKHLQQLQTPLDLSKLIAQEHVKLSLFRQILKTLVTWEP
jgi:hypothetical protein